MKREEEVQKSALSDHALKIVQILDKVSEEFRIRCYNSCFGDSFNPEILQVVDSIIKLGELALEEVSQLLMLSSNPEVVQLLNKVFQVQYSCTNQVISRFLSFYQAEMKSKAAALRMSDMPIKHLGEHGSKQNSFKREQDHVLLNSITNLTLEIDVVLRNKHVIESKTNSQAEVFLSEIYKQASRLSELSLQFIIQNKVSEAERTIEADLLSKFKNGLKAAEDLELGFFGRVQNFFKGNFPSGVQKLIFHLLSAREAEYRQRQRHSATETEPPEKLVLKLEATIQNLRQDVLLSERKIQFYISQVASKKSAINELNLLLEKSESKIERIQLINRDLRVMIKKLEAQLFASYEATLRNNAELEESRSCLHNTQQAVLSAQKKLADHLAVQKSTVGINTQVKRLPQPNEPQQQQSELESVEQIVPEILIHEADEVELSLSAKGLAEQGRWPKVKEEARKETEQERPAKQQNVYLEKVGKKKTWRGQASLGEAIYTNNGEVKDTKEVNDAKIDRQFKEEQQKQIGLPSIASQQSFVSELRDRPMRSNYGQNYRHEVDRKNFWSQVRPEDIIDVLQLKGKRIQNEKGSAGQTRRKHLRRNQQLLDLELKGRKKELSQVLRERGSRKSLCVVGMKAQNSPEHLLRQGLQELLGKEPRSMTQMLESVKGLILEARPELKQLESRQVFSKTFFDSTLNIQQDQKNQIESESVIPNLLNDTAKFTTADLQLFGGQDEAFKFQSFEFEPSSKKLLIKKVMHSTLQSLKKKKIRLSEIERASSIFRRDSSKLPRKQQGDLFFAYLQELQAKNRRKFEQIAYFIKFPYKATHEGQTRCLPISLTQLRPLFDRVLKKHQGCGKNCSHLNYFYEKIGFVRRGARKNSLNRF